jgi:predicted AlkP superfamily phosphohydrolase/phosphomutase
MKQHRELKKLVIIGLDMGDGDLIRYWASQGRLPNFAELIDSGIWSSLETTAEVLHTSTWPTFATGALPGKHGVYYPYQPKPGSQLAAHIEADQYGVPTMWKVAADQGAECLVYDVPETFPEEEYSGRGIYDWGTWAWYGRPASQPAALLKDLKARFGNYPLGMEAKRLGLRFPEPAELGRRLVVSVNYKFKSLLWLLEQSVSDLAIVGFGETHPAGHYLWPGGVNRLVDGNADRFKEIFEIYRALDEGLGSLRAALKPGTGLMILSGDGVRANNVACHLLGPMLEKLGYTASTLNGGDEGESGGRRQSLLGRAKRMLPKGTKRWIADHLPWWLRDRLGSQAGASEIDWSRTRAFTLPTDLEGCIRVNLKGREPEGIVAPGAEYRELCNSLREDLSALTHPATGEPAVQKVWIRDEVFPGPMKEHLPDVVVTWNDRDPFDALVSPTGGRAEEPSPDPRTGTHSTQAFLLTVIPGIAAGRELTGRLVDVAPTALDLLGYRAGDQMDGRPMTFEQERTEVNAQP